MLSDVAIRALPIPQKGQRYYWDEHGLCIRVSEGGSKTFYLVYGSDRKHIKLGRFPILSLKDARTKTRQILAEKQLGIYTPPSSAMLDTIIERYLAAYKIKNKPRTVRDAER